MPIISTTLKSQVPLNWSWPLRIAIFSDQFQVEREIRNVESRDFLQSNTLTSRKPNGGEQQILLFPDGLASLANVGRMRVHAGIVIIVENPTNFPKEFVQWESLNGIARLFGAAGVFIVPLAQKFIVPWLDSLTQELARDKNFIETFAKYAPDGILFFDGKTNWQRPVSQALDHLQRKLSRLGPGAVIPFRSPENFVAPDDLMEEIARARYSIRDTTDLARFSMYLAHAVDRVEYRSETMLEQRGDSRESREGIEPESAKIPDIPEAQRFLQAKLYSKSAPETAIKTQLAPHSPYVANVRIGFADLAYVHAPDSFPDSIVFERTASTEEPIQIYFIADGQEAQTATLILPRNGNSVPVEFDFLTGGVTDRFECQLMALHRNRVIQWVTLSAAVAERPVVHTTVQMTTILCTRSALSNLSTRSDFGAAFIVEESDGEAGITALKMAGPVTLPSSQGARKLMENIKYAIEAAAKRIEEYPEDLFHKKNVELLWTLAMHGEALYQHFTHGQDFIGPLQVVEHQSDFIPINFVYSFGPPAEKAGLCEHAVTALREGKCRDCFNKHENPASHICPFGFWGFSKVIEYCRAEPSGAGPDFVLKSEPSSGRDVLQILNHTIHGSAAKVEGTKPGLRQEVMETIRGFTKEIYSAETWNEWAALTEAYAPDSIVLIVHTDKTDAQISQVYIGEDPLIQNYLGKKYIASKQRPIAIVIGCEVADINNQGFDIGSEFLQKGAAVVITNFTKIRGTQAAKIVQLLVQFLKENSNGEGSFGEVMLKLKQHLLADGIIVSMSLVTYGDADWKFKS